MGKTKADAPKKADNKLAVKKGAAGKAVKKPKKTKADKDPNKPKRPPSAFFVFMEEFRKQFKEKNPNNKSVAAVGKAAGAKWKSMSEAEKAPFVNKANKRKAEYSKMMDSYSRKDRGENDAEDENESDKSKSEVNDDDDDSEEDASGEESDDE